MRTIKTIFLAIVRYVVRIAYSLVNKDLVRPMELTKEEKLYSYLEANKERLQYLMYQKNKSGYIDFKAVKEVEKYNKELKDALNLTGNSYRYRRPLWISSRMKKFLNNDMKFKEDMYEKDLERRDKLDKTFEEMKAHFKDKIKTEK